MDVEEIKIQYLGLIQYDQGLIAQQNAFDEICAGKTNGILIICEHPPVYTFGKRAKPEHLLADENWLLENSAEVFKTERGGDITFHGPGQLVVYPILNLAYYGLGVKRYVNLLEESMIRLCADYGLKAERIDGLTGIWLKADDTKPDRKIGAIGIKISQGVSMHGLAFNVNTQMDYFGKIVPCGIEDKSVTSLALELGQRIDFKGVEKAFGDIFLTLLMESLK